MVNYKGAQYDTYELQGYIHQIKSVDDKLMRMEAVTAGSTTYESLHDVLTPSTDYVVPAGKKLIIFRHVYITHMATTGDKMGYADAANVGTNFVPLVAYPHGPIVNLDGCYLVVPSGKYPVYYDATTSQTYTCMAWETKN